MSFSRIIFTLMFCAVLAVFAAGCKKEEIPGPRGEPGAPGGGGNSSITSSSTFTVNSSQWKVDSVAGVLKVNIMVPELTKEVIEKGVVKVYILDNGLWSELPFVRGDLFTQFGFSEGLLILSYINIEGGIPAAPQTAPFRMVVIKEV